MTALFDAQRHEPLQALAWDEAAARAWIARYADDAQRAFTPAGLWPVHPRDANDDAKEGEVTQPFTMVYLGAAGVIDANADHRSLEMLWGSPGTMLVAMTMHEWTGEERWADLFRTDARRLLRTLLPAADAPCRIWTQDLYGKHVHYIGAGHGFAGNASALIRGRHLLAGPDWGAWQDDIVTTVHATAMRDGALANWPALLVPAGTALRMLVQWCHGAPGIITSLASLPDPRLDELLVAAGELTWTAGPLCKGVGLCHGTDGNGYALLKIFNRTGDERWLGRARAFAMHAMLQSKRLAALHGQRRHALWIGDAGLAWYLWSCIEGDGRLPTLDAWA